MAVVRFGSVRSHLGSCKTKVLISMFIYIFVISWKCKFSEAFDQVIAVHSSKDLDPQPPQWTEHIPGGVRCYCNRPECVATGYMCKSESGCFADLLNSSSDVFNAQHGCLEFLSDRKTECKVESTNGEWTKAKHPRSLLLCCYKDMCNHVDSPEARSKLNDTLLSSGFNGSESHTVPHVVEPTPKYTESEVWFKAAIIAVPICGVLILLVLIVLAIKILRSDSDKLSENYMSSMEYKSNIDHLDVNQHDGRYVRKLSLLYDEPHSLSCHGADNTVAPLLIQDPTQFRDRKNETFAKLNSAKNINMPNSMSQIKVYDKPNVQFNQ